MMGSQWTYQPASLQSFCLDSVVNNISLLVCMDHGPIDWPFCSLHGENITNNFAAASREVANDFLPPVTKCTTCMKFRRMLTLPLAEHLLATLSSSDKLTDDTLRAFVKLYNYPYRRLHLYIGNLLTMDGMCSLSKLNLNELKLNASPTVSSTSPWSVKDLISSFRNSAMSLKSLEIDLILTSRLIGGGDIVDFITTFPNLRVLRMKSEIEDKSVFDCSTWERLMTGCPKLEVLNVSFPKLVKETLVTLDTFKSGKEITLDSTIFYKYGQNTLRSMGLHGALSLDPTIERRESLYCFRNMNVLTHLDLSIDVDPDPLLSDIHPLDDNLAKKQEILAKQVEQVLQAGQDVLPSLVSLDVSGLIRLRDSAIEDFLASHPRMHFLGLCLTKSKFCLDDILPDTIQVSGIHLANQIMLSLTLYPLRGTYLKEALKGLFHISSDWTIRKPKVIELVLRSMQDHASDMLLQMAGTACLYNLTRERDDLQGEDVHITLLNKTAELTAAALTKGLGTIQIVKNCLLIFCNDRILHQASFDRFNMIRVCLDCMALIPESTDHNVTRMAVAIVSILACKITSHETAALTTEKDMKLLLDLLRRRIQLEEADGTMKFDLSALWNLTDESPKACEMFVNNGGMDLYVGILQEFKDHSVQTKILGLLNNIAEVDYLLDSLLRMDLLRFVRDLISNEQVAVSYFSAGIVANLLYVWKDEWSTSYTPKSELSMKLEQAVKKWGRLNKSVVGYRSFRPFINLLVAYHIPEVQTWAVWAIHHVCSLNPQRYAEVLTDECYSLLLQLKESVTCTNDMRERIEEIGKVSKRTSAH